MPVIMVHSLELTEKQKKIMAQKYTSIMSELTKVPEERIYCFFSGYPLNAISAGGTLNSAFPDSALKQFDIQYTQELLEKEAIRVASRMKVKSGKETQARKELMSLLIKTREEAGCLGYDLYESKNNTELGSYFLLREKWVDSDAIGYHTSTDFFKAFMSKSEELFEGTMEVTKEFDSARHNDCVNTEGKIVLIQKAKAKPDKEDEIKYGLVDIMKIMSNRPACKMYDVFQGFEGIYDTSVFFTFQIWDNQKDLDDAATYLSSRMPFSAEDLAEPWQPLIFEMVSSPV